MRKVTDRNLSECFAIHSLKFHQEPRKEYVCTSLAIFEAYVNIEDGKGANLRLRSKMISRVYINALHTDADVELRVYGKL